MCAQAPFITIASSAAVNAEYADLWQLLHHMLHPVQASRARIQDVYQSKFLSL